MATQKATTNSIDIDIIYNIVAYVAYILKKKYSNFSHIRVCFLRGDIGDRTQNQEANIKKCVAFCVALSPFPVLMGR